METSEKVKEIINKNRLLTAISAAWIVLSNLLYFSRVGETWCSSLRDLFNGTNSFPSQPPPDWEIFWHKLSLYYVPLYESIRDTDRVGDVTCSHNGFSETGYFVFLLLPIFTMILLVITIKWVRRR